MVWSLLLAYIVPEINEAFNEDAPPDNAWDWSFDALRG
jgi:hypothetical protein